MKHCKRLLAVLLAAFTLASMAALHTSAAADIAIANPYANVNWGTYGQFRTQLHTHTTASDGTGTLAQMAEAYYAKGYHALAITDHGIVDRSWTQPNHLRYSFYRNAPNFSWIVKSQEDKPIEGLTPARLAQLEAGTGRADGRGMVRVSLGIEQNPGGGDGMGGLVHVNSFFTDWGNGIPGGEKDFSFAVQRVAGAGGLSMINHPTLGFGNRDVPLALVYEAADDYLVNKLQVLFGDAKYKSSLIGMEIHNATHDRKLWDVLLRNLAPTGRNIFIIPTDDAHNAQGAVDRRWVVALMPANTEANLNACLKGGAFFGARRFTGSPVTQGMELEPQVQFIDGYDDMPPGLQAAAEPKVTGITANSGVITIAGDDISLVTWIADGKVIAQGPSIDLADHIDDIGAYVRAEIWGADVVLHTQPFLLTYAGMPAARPVHPKFKDSGVAATKARKALYPFYAMTERLWRKSPEKMDRLYDIGLYKALFYVVHWPVTGICWFFYEYIPSLCK